MDIQIYGDVDKKYNQDTGRMRIVAMKPAWSCGSQIADLRESIGRKERALVNGTVASDQIHRTRNELDRDKRRLRDILKSKPKLETTGEKDFVAKMYKILRPLIASSMFSRKEMEEGFADAHDEASRMKDYLIMLTDEQQCFAEACNVRVVDGKANRDGVSKMWKICGELLGEPTNIERLRPDKPKRAK